MHLHACKLSAVLTHALFTPHPPAIIPAIGGTAARDFSETIGALLTGAQTLRAAPPDTLVVVSAKGEVRLDRFTIRVPTESIFTADFAEFGVTDGATARTYPRDRIFTAQLIEAGAGSGLTLEPVTGASLDYGAAVPLYYLMSGVPHASIVTLSLSLTSATDHVRLGQLIRELADESDKRVALVVSAELSHRVSKASPFGVHPTAARWDRELVSYVQANNATAISALDPFIADEVGGQQYRGAALLLGALGVDFHNLALTYEAPGGIGCLTGAWERRAG